MWTYSVIRWWIRCVALYETLIDSDPLLIPSTTLQRFGLLTSSDAESVPRFFIFFKSALPVGSTSVGQSSLYEQKTIHQVFRLLLLHA